MDEDVPQRAQLGRLIACHTEAVAIVLFDGVCNLCSASVRYIIDRDPSGYFQFASLQSKVGAELLAEHGMKPPEGDPDSILLIEDGVVHDHSTAALRIARKLASPIKILSIFRIVPRFLRDLVYRFIARNRYRWFGRTDTCAVPTPQLRARFLD